MSKQTPVGAVRFKLTDTSASVTWIPDNGQSVVYECAFDNDRENSGSAPARLPLLGTPAKRDRRSLSFFLRLALAQHEEQDGWFIHAPANLERLPGWGGLTTSGSRMNAARDFANGDPNKGCVTVFERGVARSKARPPRSRLVGVSLPDFDADTARRWLGIDDPRGMRDQNGDLSWAAMAKLALTSSAVQQPYFDAAIELCPCPLYRGWTSDEVRIRIDGDLTVSSRFARAASIFPEASAGGSRNRYSLYRLPERPLADDRSIQEFTLLRSDHLTFALTGLMLKNTCFDADGNLVGPGGVQSGRHVISAFPLRASGTTYNVDAEVIVETSDEQILFARRPKLGRYAADTWSASIEEQLDEEDDVLNPEFYPGNAIFNCAIRGMMQELHIARHEIAELRLMSVFIGALVYSGSFLFYSRLTLPYREVRHRVPCAHDKREHAAIAASPRGLDQIKKLLAANTYEPMPAMFEPLEPEHVTLAARWHPNSKLRLFALGSFHRYELPPLDTFSARAPEAEALRSVRR